VYKNTSKTATKNKPKMATKSQNSTFSKLQNQTAGKLANVAQTKAATSIHQSGLAIDFKNSTNPRHARSSLVKF